MRSRKISTLAAAFLTLCTIFCMAQTQSVQEIEKQKQAADREIRETKAELTANEKKVNQTLASLRQIEQDISASQTEIATVQGQIDRLNKEISTLEGSISTGEKELEGLRAEYLKAVKKMRVARKKNSDLAFIFASKSFNEAQRRMRYMKEFSEWKDRRSGEISEKVNTLRRQREQLAQARSDASVALSRQQAAREKLTRQKGEQETVVAQLKANSETLKGKLAKRQAEARKLSNQISALIAEQKAKEEAQRKAREAQEAEARRKAAEEKRLAEEKAAADKQAAEEKAVAEAKPKKETRKETAKKDTKKDAKKDTKKEAKKESPKQETKGEYAEARKRNPRGSSAPAEKSQPAVASTESGFGGMKGALPKPVSGSFRIVSAFGVHPISPELPDIMDENLGIDAHVANGAAACAVYDGEVIKVYDRTNTPGFRNIVVVKHGDYITVYANLESLSVHTGQTVKQGQKLGAVGADFDEPSKGLIHFEVWKNQTHLDPAAWIKI